jgi:hypothetical protein
LHTFGEDALGFGRDCDQFRERARADAARKSRHADLADLNEPLSVSHETLRDRLVK